MEHHWACYSGANGDGSDDGGNGSGSGNGSGAVFDVVIVAWQPTSLFGGFTLINSLLTRIAANKTLLLHHNIQMSLLQFDGVFWLVKCKNSVMFVTFPP